MFEHFMAHSLKVQEFFPVSLYLYVGKPGQTQTIVDSPQIVGHRLDTWYGVGNERNHSMTGYTKLFQSILASSIWGEDDKTRIVWITMLALSNRDGFIAGSVAGLARQAVVSKEDCERALLKFESPDPDSTTKDNEGRRIKTVDGGWLLLNHAKYRAMMSLEERREYNRMKKQEYRTKERLANKELSAREIIKNNIAAEEAVNGR